MEQTYLHTHPKFVNLIAWTMLGGGGIASADRREWDGIRKKIECSPCETKGWELLFRDFSQRMQTVVVREIAAIQASHNRAIRAERSTLIRSWRWHLAGLAVGMGLALITWRTGYRRTSVIGGGVISLFLGLSLCTVHRMRSERLAVLQATSTDESFDLGRRKAVWSRIWPMLHDPMRWSEAAAALTPLVEFYKECETDPDEQAFWHVRAKDKYCIGSGICTSTDQGCSIGAESFGPVFGALLLYDLVKKIETNSVHVSAIACRARQAASMMRAARSLLMFPKEVAEILVGESKQAQAFVKIREHLGILKPSDVGCRVL